MRARLPLLIALTVLPANLPAAGVSAASGVRTIAYHAPTARDWQQIAALPDWSGIWLPDIGDQDAQISSNPVPWKREISAQIAAMNVEEAAGHPRGLFTNCLPEGMPSWMLVGHNAVEFLFSPGRVTILGESDGNRLRRIYTDGRDHPPAPDPSFHGHSIGHWRGGTLEVDTVAILPETYIAVSEAAGVPNNGGMHITERLHLEGADRLKDELEIVAPKVLTKPWKTTRTFVRQRSSQYEIVEGVCAQGGYLERLDQDGNAVWSPVPQGENGVPAPGGP